MTAMAEISQNARRRFSRSEIPKMCSSCVAIPYLKKMLLAFEP